MTANSKFKIDKIQANGAIIPSKHFHQDWSGKSPGRKFDEANFFASSELFLRRSVSRQ